MIMPIKKKYFDMIKSGKKDIEWRDAHITFICEETGDKLRKYIESVRIIDKEEIIELSPDEKKEIFTDDKILEFQLI